MLGNISIFIILLLGICQTVRSQVPFPGSCPDVKIVETFDLDKYMGTWYEYSKYPFIFEAGQKCQHAVYKNNGNGTVSVTNTGIYVIINRPSSISGIAKVIAPGQLAVAFRNQQVEKPNYLILGTDYDNWVVVYSCRNISSYGHARSLMKSSRRKLQSDSVDNLQCEIIWILTRQRIPPPEAVQAAEKIISDNKLSDTFMIKSTQDDCPTATESANDDQVASATTEDQTIAFSSTTAGNIIEVA